MDRFRRLARRARLALAAAALALAGAAAQQGPEAPDRPSPPRVLVLAVKGAITGGTAEFLEAGLEKAKVEGHAAVAITLDTPGGMLDATREIVQAMLAAEIPVVVWVGPAGAHAGSAGVFLTLAADVAAMHPTSNIGAAHPVTGSGKDVEQEAGKDMAKKVENDTAAFARSVAKANGRNADWAEKAVRESVAVTADEAVKLRVVDFTAPDLRATLEKADGRTVETPSGKRTFRGKDAVMEPYEKTVRQRVLSFLADPNVVALLFTLGTLGIAIEFYHPGMVVPGVIGAFSLLLAFLAMRVIPVNVGAVLLILAGVGLLVAEAYVTVHGLAGLGGAAAIVLGTLFFIDKSSPDYQFDPGAFSISPWIVWPTPIALSLLLGFMAWKIASARRGPLKIGASALIGSEGETLSVIGPDGGEVFVHGEYWRGRSDAPIPKGARVRVVSVEGLVVTVVADDPGTR
ncbi:MAG TPA: nodulation protein NfeD [Anaeromyxobacteraceae bacterium]|nr:nodulation protein NfeD [Anaeromyxobacteraceae bacterium]